MCIVAMLVATPRAMAQALPLLGPAAGSVAAEGAESSHGGHGWAVVPEPRGGGYLLVHLPPRTSAREGRLSGSAPGTVRMPLRLEEAPEAIAAVGDEVFLVFRPTLVPQAGAGPASDGGGSEVSGMRSVRQVYSLTAISLGVGDLWEYSPRGRLAAEASLPGDGVLAGFAGTPVGPAALIDRGPREGSSGVETGEVDGVRATPRPPPDLSLSVLHAGVWQPVRLPEIPAIEGTERVLRRFMLASSEEGFALLATRPARQAVMWRAAATLEQVRGPLIEWRRAVDAARTALEVAGEDVNDPATAIDLEAAEREPLPPVEVAWTSSPLQLPAGDERTAMLPTGPLAVVGSRVVFGHTDGVDGVAVFSVGAGAPERLARFDTVVVEGDEQVQGRKTASVAGVVALVGPRRVAVILAPLGEGGDRGMSLIDAPARLRVVEVSADTGAVVYDGAATSGSGFDRDSFQAVLLVVLAMTAVLLVWTVRAGRREDVVKLPEGSALAEPGKRLAAGMIDFIVACVLAGWLLGVPLLDVLTLRAVVGPEAELRAAVLLLGVGVGVSGVLELLAGASVGKLAMGMRVVATRGPRAGTWRAAGVGRALGRNLFRWVAWPVAIFGLGRPDGRHLGDRLSGTAVVVRVEVAVGEEKKGEDGDDAV